ncbi:MAG: ABC transporter substrate-binding protein [Candidatus Binatia bacterium]
MIGRFITLLMLVALFVYTPSVLRAQEGSDSSLIEGAKKEGQVVWYTTMNVSQSKPVMDAFHKRYPFIETVLYRAGGGALLNRVLTEARAGKYDWDVVGGRGEMILAFKERNLLASYASPEAQMIDSDLFDKQGYWYTYYVVPVVLGYNTNLTKREEIPKSYTDLLEPKWKGKKISMDTEAYLLLQGLISAWGKEKALNFMKQLAAQEPVMMRGTTERITMAAAGEYPLVITYAHSIQRMVSKGASIDWVALEPAVVEIDPLMIGAKAPHPHAARLFLNFLLSKEGQEMLVRLQRIPVRRDVQPKPARLFRGYQRIVERPGDYKDFSENVKLFEAIFKTR